MLLRVNLSLTSPSPCFSARRQGAGGRRPRCCSWGAEGTGSRPFWDCFPTLVLLALPDEAQSCCSSRPGVHRAHLSVHWCAGVLWHRGLAGFPVRFSATSVSCACHLSIKVTGKAKSYLSLRLTIRLHPVNLPVSLRGFLWSPKWDAGQKGPVL